VEVDLDRLLADYANPPGAPGSVTGPHRFAEVAEPVAALRERVYRAAMPHLLEPTVVAMEERLRIDEETDHLCAWADDGALTAALRVSPRPIELPALSARCAELVAGQPAHGEISRVITDPLHRRREHINRLLAAMVRSMLAGGEAVGVMGLCRRRVVRFYARFGLTAVHDDPLAVPGRPDADYFVIAATFDAMVDAGMHRLVRAAGTEVPGPAGAG
jgi:predicted GNAT family N-acyltransferase